MMLSSSDSSSSIAFLKPVNFPIPKKGDKNENDAVRNLCEIQSANQIKTTIFSELEVMNHGTSYVWARSMSELDYLR